MSTEIPDNDSIHARNKTAWDALYRDTEGSVWGAAPIPFVEEFISDLSGDWSSASRVLDAASGEGRHLPLLLNTGSVVHACDSSEHALEKLTQAHGSAHASRCDLDQLPYRSAEFDFISLIDTIETLPNPVVCLKELNRVLKPEGLLLCNIPGIEDEISSNGMNPVDGLREGAFLYEGTYFYRFYDEREATAILRCCGFSIVRSEVRTWEESPHPGFRDYEHQHTSRVFLLRKALSRSGN